MNGWPPYSRTPSVFVLLQLVVMIVPEGTKEHQPTTQRGCGWILDYRSRTSPQNHHTFLMVTTRTKAYNDKLPKPLSPPRQKRTPTKASAPKKVSTPGEESVESAQSSSSRLSYKHIWKHLLEDIEANGGLKLLLSDTKEQKLHRLFEKLIAEDESGNKRELYLNRKIIGQQVRRWKKAYAVGEYDDILKKAGILSFEERSRAQLLSQLDGDSSSPSSDEDSSTQDSLDSARPPSSAPKQTKLKSPPRSLPPAASKNVPPTEKKQKSFKQEKSHKLPSEIRVPPAVAEEEEKEEDPDTNLAVNFAGLSIPDQEEPFKTMSTWLPPGALATMPPGTCKYYFSITT